MLWSILNAEKGRKTWNIFLDWHIIELQVMMRDCLDESEKWLLHKENNMYFTEASKVD